MTRRALLVAAGFAPPHGGQSPHIRVEAGAEGYRELPATLRPKGGQSSVAFDLVLVKE